MIGSTSAGIRSFHFLVLRDMSTAMECRYIKVLAGKGHNGNQTAKKRGKRAKRVLLDTNVYENILLL
ncbi:hypothetical protein HYY74_05175 [Candidatus Woesearchaeota archaeon]|nr:hypothetical protein [Candidatus Woesearchaeota archaeon]